MVPSIFPALGPGRQQTAHTLMCAPVGERERKSVRRRLRLLFFFSFFEREKLRYFCKCVGACNLFLFYLIPSSSSFFFLNIPLLFFTGRLKKRRSPVERQMFCSRSCYKHFCVSFSWRQSFAAATTTSYSAWESFIDWDGDNMVNKTREEPELIESS